MANDLKNRWLNLVSDYDMPTSAAEAMFRVIKAHYTEPHRAYHNLNHLEEAFTVFDSVQDKLKNSNTVAFAIFFHDIIYDVTQPDNEEKSAEFALPLLHTIGLAEGDIAEITKMILTTKTHQCSDHNSDIAFMLDIDMSILAADTKRYAEYAQQIRAERSNIADKDFFKARRDLFLKPCLAQDRIFHTDYFKDLLEGKARQNMKAEIDLLTQELAKLESNKNDPLRSKSSFKK